MKTLSRHQVHRTAALPHAAGCVIVSIEVQCSSGDSELAAGSIPCDRVSDRASTRRPMASRGRAGCLFDRGMAEHETKPRSEPTCSTSFRAACDLSAQLVLWCNFRADTRRCASPLHAVSRPLPARRAGGAYGGPADRRRFSRALDADRTIHRPWRRDAFARDRHDDDHVHRTRCRGQINAGSRGDEGTTRQMTGATSSQPPHALLHAGGLPAHCLSTGPNC